MNTQRGDLFQLPVAVGSDRHNGGPTFSGQHVLQIVPVGRVLRKLSGQISSTDALVVVIKQPP